MKPAQTNVLCNALHNPIVFSLLIYSSAKQTEKRNNLPVQIMIGKCHFASAHIYRESFAERGDCTNQNRIRQGQNESSGDSFTWDEISNSAFPFFTTTERQDVKVKSDSWTIQSL